MTFYLCCLTNTFLCRINILYDLRLMLIRKLNFYFFYYTLSSTVFALSLSFFLFFVRFYFFLAFLFIDFPSIVLIIVNFSSVQLFWINCWVLFFSCCKMLLYGMVVSRSRGLIVYQISNDVSAIDDILVHKTDVEIFGDLEGVWYHSLMICIALGTELTERWDSNSENGIV